MKKRVADIIMDVLIENGITDSFAVVGGGSMHLDNALGLKKEIHKIFNHHEQACAMAAEAYAKIEGKLPAVFVTSGPGATNTLTGVMGAYVDSIPMLIISGQVRYELSVPKTGLPLRFRGGQEFNIVDTVQTMTKYAKMVTDPLTIKAEINKAIQIAMSGRRGPVWLDIPLDVQMAQVEENDLIVYESADEFDKNINFDVIEQIMTEIEKAERPVILVGNGVGNSGAIPAFRKLASVLSVPVIAAAQASDVMYRENSHYYGIAGIIGWRSGNFVLQNADLIISIGTSLGFKTTGYAQEEFAKNARIIMIDADPYEPQKPGLHINQFICAEANSLLELWNQKARIVNIASEWKDYCDYVKNKFDVYEVTDTLDMNERVCSYYFWKLHDEIAPDDDMTILGNNTAISAKVQIGVLKEKQRTMTNDNCGSMGYDLPAAIGAAVAADRTVICATGDGSIMMNLQELQTIKHYHLPIKIVIFSNDGYNAFRQTSKNFFNGFNVGCDAASGVSFPSFEKVADSFGYAYHHCRCNADVRESLEWLYSVEGQAILEVDQRLDDPVTPKIMSRINDQGEFETPQLHDMYPFLSKDTLKSLMIDIRSRK